MSEKQQNVELSYLKPNNNPMDMNMGDYVTPHFQGLLMMPLNSSKIG